MFETELINEIRERLSIFIGLYDSIRIVDPIKKELIKEEGGPAVIQGGKNAEQNAAEIVGQAVDACLAVSQHFLYHHQVAVA